MEDYTPIANKMLNADGGVTTFDGTQVQSPSGSGVEEYNSRIPIANKFLDTDGTVKTLSDVLGGGGGGQPTVVTSGTLDVNGSGYALTIDLTAEQQTAISDVAVKANSADLFAETNAREQGDTDTLSSANAYTDSEVTDLSGVVEDNDIVSGTLSYTSLTDVKITLTKGDNSVVTIPLTTLANLFLQLNATHANGSTTLTNTNGNDGVSLISTQTDVNTLSAVETNTESGNPVTVGFYIKHAVNTEDNARLLGVITPDSKKRFYLLKDKTVPDTTEELDPNDELLNLGEVVTAINTRVSAAISGALPLPTVLSAESALPDISGGSAAVQYYVIENMDVSSPNATRQGRAWCGVGETAWHSIIDITETLSLDFFQQQADGSWVIRSDIQALIDGAVQGSQIITTEPTTSSTDSQVVSAKRIRTMFGAALSTLATTAKTVVGAINELVTSVGGKLDKVATANVLYGTNASGNQTTISQSTYIGEAPTDGQAYNRQSSAWVVAQSGGGGTPVTYPTTETTVNETWGGKQLYLQRFSGAITASGGALNNTTLISSAVDELVAIGGWLCLGSSDKVAVGTIVRSDSYTNVGGSELHITGNALILGSLAQNSRAGATGGGYNIWAKYTKTT